MNTRAHLVLVVSLLTCAAIVPCDAAAKKPKPRLVGTAGPVYTDGSRFAVVQSDTGVRVRDDRRGVAFYVPQPRNCGFADVHGGELLWACRPDSAQGESSALIYDLASRTLHRAIGTERVTARARSFPMDGTSYYRYVGRHWVAGNIIHENAAGKNENTDFWLNWRTGEYREGDQGDARSIPDLNRPALTQSMCPPLRRRSAPEELDYPGSSSWLPYQYERPYGLPVLTPGANDRVVLERCRRTPITLSECATSREIQHFANCAFQQLGGRLVTWHERALVAAYSIRKRRLYRWRFPHRGPAGGYPLLHVSHTKQRIYVWQPKQRFETESKRYVIRVPR